MRSHHSHPPDALSRRRALDLSAGSLLALGLWPGALRAADAAPGGTFRFVVVNDVHYRDDRCGAWLEKVFRQIKAAPDKPDFCLIAGDYSENGTRAELTAVRDAFKLLGIPTFGVIGNHDYTAQNERQPYEELFPGRLNYRFEQHGWQFLALDSTQGRQGNNTSIQPHTLRWVDDQLPKLDRKRPLVLLTHFPLGPITPARPLNADALLERFKPFNLEAVFCGHFHGFTERRVGDTTLTTNRCCSAWRANHDFSKEKGWFMCEAKEGRLIRAFVEIAA
jgi:3',5'-cyclic AMP phosphodiesterase CpdA